MALCMICALFLARILLNITDMPMAAIAPNMLQTYSRWEFFEACKMHLCGSNISHFEIQIRPKFIVLECISYHYFSYSICFKPLDILNVIYIYTFFCNVSFGSFVDLVVFFFFCWHFGWLYFISLFSLNLQWSERNAIKISKLNT